MHRSRLLATGLITALSLLAGPMAAAQTMSFFLTSEGLGSGADLGGIEGADAHCQTLADAAGFGHRTWAAYLSTQGNDPVHARHRIGDGPWHNAEGVLIAMDIDRLHEVDVNINHASAIDENGNRIPFAHLDEEGNTLAPELEEVRVQHDILTGSREDGTAFPAGEDRTCNNWTSSDEGSAMVGHHDRRTLQPGVFSSWNAAHPSAGCSQPELVRTGGAGLFYCFATD